MRKLVPYLGIAVAVALGIAAAPYLWRVFGLAAVLVVAWVLLGVIGLSWQWIQRRVKAWIDQGLDPPDV